MKKMKINKYILNIVLIISIYACNQNTNKTLTQEKGFSKLKERNTKLASLSDWQSIKSKAEFLYKQISSDSSDTKSKLLLAQLYMQEARITGEHPYYYPATLEILESVLKNDPENFEALAYKSSVLLSLHHFKEALETGKKAITINSSNGFIYGVLCDANVELGNYEEAVRMSDIMQSIKPGLESYSRASYLREIYGDNTGAIEAMQMAVKAGMASTEESAWAANTLCQLYMNEKDYANAEMVSNTILEQRPNYAFAIETLGKIKLLKGKYDEAISLFKQAIEVMPEFSFYENMAKAYEAKGMKKEAEEIYKNVITMLKEDAESGHYVDNELALVYLKINDLNNAHKHAMIEYQRRPENIDVNATLSLVYFNQKKYDEAKNHMKIALKTGKNNNELNTQAVLINNSNS